MKVTPRHTHTQTHMKGTHACVQSVSNQNTVITFSEKYSTHTHTHIYTHTHTHTHTRKARTHAYNQSPNKTQSLTINLKTILVKRHVAQRTFSLVFSSYARQIQTRGQEPTADSIS